VRRIAASQEPLPLVRSVLVCQAPLIAPSLRVTMAPRPLLQSALELKRRKGVRLGRR
jgi:hypothetical protein